MENANTKVQLSKGTLLSGGKYIIESILGQGGFGITYKAVLKTKINESLGSVDVEFNVAIKEFFYQDYCSRGSDSNTISITGSQANMFGEFKKKLIKEAHILSSLRHPNIVDVLEVFEENNTAYIVMKYIAGKSLKEILEEQGALPESQAIDIIRQISDALVTVHDKNILHLDIKPSNILIEKNTGKAYLIDFGASKRYDGTSKSETSFTPAARSKGYAPPEQYLEGGVSLFSASTDVYALGACFYKLVTNVTPPESLAIYNDLAELQPPRSISPMLSRRTESVILRALQLKRNLRYQSIPDFLNDLSVQTDGTRVENIHERSKVDSEPIQPPPISQKVKNDTETTTIKPARSIPHWISTIGGALTYVIAKFAIFEGEMNFVVGVIAFAVGSLLTSILINLFNSRKNSELEKGSPSPHPVSLPNQQQNGLQKASRFSRLWKNNKVTIIVFLSIFFISLIIAVVTKGPSAEELEQLRQDSISAVLFPLTNELIEIQGAEFVMGNSNGYDDEKPVHKVSLSSFGISPTEVTVGQFNAFVQESGYVTDAERKGSATYIENGKSESKGDINWRHDEQGNLRDTWQHDYPVIRVSWNDATAFCKWLSERTGYNYRLPSEAEMEYVAGNGTNYTKYSWGAEEPGVNDKLENLADMTAKDQFPDWEVFDNYNDGYVFSAPVGSFKSNKFGIHDLSGNVMEWCYDWYDAEYYADSPYGDPLGPSSGSYKAIRGGAWVSKPAGAILCFRIGNKAREDCDYDLGFRVVKSQH